MKDIEYILRYYSINFFRVSKISKFTLSIEYPMNTGLYTEFFAMKGKGFEPKQLIEVIPEIVTRQIRKHKTYSVRNKWKSKL